jgi:hypothetical protein
METIAIVGNIAAIETIAIVGNIATRETITINPYLPFS